MARKPTIREPATDSSIGKIPGQTKIREPVLVEDEDEPRKAKAKPGMTTIEVSTEVRDQLEAMKVDSKEAIARTVERLIDTGEYSSTGALVTLKIPRNKYEWLIRKQKNLDCIYVLRGYVR